MTFDSELLHWFDPWIVHSGLCAICRSGDRCLDRALHDLGLDELNERDDEGYLVAPHFVRVRAAEKAGASFSNLYDWLKGKTIVWKYGNEEIGRTGPKPEDP